MVFGYAFEQKYIKTIFVAAGRRLRFIGTSACVNKNLNVVGDALRAC